MRNVMLRVLVVLAWCGMVMGVARELTDAEYASFPRLFHLDDLESCLLRDDALYCLGEFQLTASVNHPVMPLIKAYSEDIFNFNRTRIHRGYCVSNRCPQNKQISPHCPSTDRSNSAGLYRAKRLNESELYRDQNKDQINIQRFEKCVAKYAGRQGFEVQLSSLQYCRSKQKSEWKIESRHWLFLGVVGLIVMVNLLATLYDIMKSGPKSSVVTAWSMVRSWQQLTCPHPAGDPRAETVLTTEAVRVMLLMVVLFVHAGCINVSLYIGNPRFVETMSRQPIMKVFHNGHSAIQMFLLFSLFFLAQELLKSPTRPSVWMLLKLLVKRTLRICPVYVLVLGYAASWWPLTRSGPQWEPLVEQESADCRRRFWQLAFFLGVTTRERNTCLVQTWFLQIQMQLYVLTMIVTVMLWRVRRWALLLLGGMFLATVVASMLVAYVRDWSPLVMIAGPENIRALFSEEEIVYSFYTRLWSNVGACLAGLFLAHLLHHLQETKFQPHRHKWLIQACQVSILLLPCWTGGVGYWFGDLSSRAARALFVALERPVFSMLVVVHMFGVLIEQTGSNINQSLESTSPADSKGLLQRVLAWRICYPLGRMSLAVLMLHMVVNKTIAASRRGLYYTSALDMVIDTVATAFFSYVVAAPVTLLLDIPMQQLARVVTSS